MAVVGSISAIELGSGGSGGGLSVEDKTWITENVTVPIVDGITANLDEIELTLSDAHTKLDTLQSDVAIIKTNTTP